MSALKILLLGKNGQVGRALLDALPPLGHLLALDREGIDLNNLERLQAVLDAARADVIVNAAAYTNVEAAERDFATAARVNGTAVELMATHAARTDSWLIHYSTDFVFDGCKGKPYVETDGTNPRSAYGLSKRLGEQAIEQTSCKALVLRTSWVHSPYGRNFVRAVLERARQGDTLKVVSDQVGTPTSAQFIASATARAIAAATGGYLAPGLYHLAATGAVSRYDFARHLVAGLRARGARLRLAPDNIRAIRTADHPALAPRPCYSALDSSRLGKALALDIPHWRCLLGPTLDGMVERESVP